MHGSLFELFYQVDRNLDRSDGGLGIGLSLVKRLVEMHGGRVGVTSGGPGTGSTFEIRLPRVADAAPEAASRGAPGSPTRRVLVVDDNRDAAESLAMLLQLDGHVVEATFKGVARCLRDAVRVEGTAIPSTKGTLSGAGGD